MISGVTQEVNTAEQKDHTALSKIELIVCVVNMNLSAWDFSRQCCHDIRCFTWECAFTLHCQIEETVSDIQNRYLSTFRCV